MNHQLLCRLLTFKKEAIDILPSTNWSIDDYFHVPGYQKLKEFIVTQHPLESTISDFWQMVWDHNSQTVIVLSETNDEDYQIFWPLKQADVEFENFRVRFIDEHQIALPTVSNGASAPSDEFITQIEVAAQSLQVFTNFYHRDGGTRIDFNATRNRLSVCCFQVEFYPNQLGFL